MDEGAPVHNEGSRTGGGWREGPGQEWMNTSESDSTTIYLKAGLCKTKSTMRNIQLWTGLETDVQGATVC